MSVSGLGYHRTDDAEYSTEVDSQAVVWQRSVVCVDRLWRNFDHRRTAGAL